MDLCPVFVVVNTRYTWSMFNACITMTTWHQLRFTPHRTNMTRLKDKKVESCCNEHVTSWIVMGFSHAVNRTGHLRTNGHKQFENSNRLRLIIHINTLNWWKSVSKPKINSAENTEIKILTSKSLFCSPLPVGERQAFSDFLFEKS